MIIKKISKAKVNLYLAVGKKRKDNFHNIWTVMHSISLADELYFKVLKNTKKIKLIFKSKEKVKLQENLIYRAAKLLQDRYKVKKGVEIICKKNIPSGAGLGGGSSNAAITLKTLNKLWGLKLSKKILEILCPELGSDVAFFLNTPAALCSGKGEIVNKINSNLTGKDIIIIKPDFKINTKQAYKNLKIKNNFIQNQKIIKYVEKGDISKIKSYFINDFENFIFKKYDFYNFLSEKLKTRVFLSGSGSCCFILEEDRKKQDDILKKLRALNIIHFKKKFL